MLLGEHAVLAGKQAVVCAVNKRLHMQLIPNASSQIVVRDARLGEVRQDLNELEVVAPFKFVFQAIASFKAKLPSGFTLNINSEFSSVLGLGSSAAVTVATIAVIGQWLYNKPFSNAQIFTLAKQVMLAIQHYGSGADLAASIYGGVLAYRINPYRYYKLPQLTTLTAVYCGYKTPTPEVIALVNKAQQLQPAHYEKIFTAMHACTVRAIHAIKSTNWQKLGKLLLQHHELQRALGVSDALLDFLVQELALQPEILGAKISGSGLGDCVIGLGELPKEIFSTINGIQQFVIKIEPDGLVYQYAEADTYVNN